MGPAALTLPPFVPHSGSRQTTLCRNPTAGLDGQKPYNDRLFGLTLRERDLSLDAWVGVVVIGRGPARPSYLVSSHQALPRRARPPYGRS